MRRTRAAVMASAIVMIAAGTSARGAQDGDDGGLLPTGCWAAQQPGCLPLVVPSPFRSAVLSPDERTLYVVSPSRLQAFVRDPVSGGLSPLSGRGGCLAVRRAAGCIRLPGGAIEGVRIALGGRIAYLQQAGTLRVLRRGTDGGLIPLRGRGSCIGLGQGCIRFGPDDEQLDWGEGPDGRALILWGSEVIRVARRQRGGRLSLPRTRGNCWTTSEDGGCPRLPVLRTLDTVIISHDGRTVAADDGARVAVLRREPATGALTPVPGTSGCLSPGRPRRCLALRGVPRPRSVAFTLRAAFLNGDRSLLLWLDNAECEVSGTGFCGGEASLAMLDRVAGGGYRQRPGRAGCATAVGREGCRTAAVISGPGWDVDLPFIVDPDGHGAYLSNEFGVVRVSTDLRIDEDAFACQFPGPGCPKGLPPAGEISAFAIAGRWAYVAGRREIAILTRDRTDGRLVPTGRYVCPLPASCSSDEEAASDGLPRGLRVFLLAAGGRDAYAVTADAIVALHRAPVTADPEWPATATQLPPRG